ncbi:MAG: sigma-54-dependent Fis family transcriptional regulator [Deltaproteobacteria bacterium]|nr:MAG: sigma-54-dependent Fis family transcriptional regulator [Deltaproteobacteria bacterium]
MNQKRILVVDDEENLRHMMKIILSREGYQVYEAADGENALSMIRSTPMDLILCDVRMPRMDGMTLLETIAPKNYRPIVIMMSAYGTIETAVTAMKMGAYDYVSKPFQSDEVLLTIKKAFEHQSLKDENEQLRKQLTETRSGVDLMIGDSPPMRRLRALIERVSQYDSTVLITGESGTGKELAAREIHLRSPRRDNSFVPINCAALPESLLESELFGFKKGAFTDARADKKGLLEEANGGTLFLDEIGDLPISIQVKLLRFLQDGKIRRLGETTEREVNVRIITATNQDLKKAVDEKRFRNDLFFRLNVIQIHLPPLRERREDIPSLVDHFARRFSKKYEKPAIRIEPEVYDLFMSYPWKGNIRELENVVERVILLSEGETLSAANLPEDLFPAENRWGEFMKDAATLREAKRKLEREMIQQALLRTGGDKRKASESLGITLRALQYKIKEYQIGKMTGEGGENG